MQQRRHQQILLLVAGIGQGAHNPVAVLLSGLGLPGEQNELLFSQHPGHVSPRFFIQGSGPQGLPNLPDAVGPSRGDAHVNRRRSKAS